MKRVLIIALAPLALAGCANFSPDAGMGAVANRVRADERRDVVMVATDEEDENAAGRARALLRRGLNVERAVQVAFLRNKGLQAAYNDLGLSEAQFVAASLPPNPTVSLLSLRGAMSYDIERRLVADLLALATLPARRDIAETSWRKAQLEAIASTLRLAADVRRQYWKAAGARAQTKYLLQARANAETTAELAHKLGETGALNKLDQGREFAFYAELAAQVAKARTQEKIEKERLTRLMGLWGQDIDYALPQSLPGLPPAPRAFAALETQALDRRVDVAMARADLEKTAKELGLTQATRFVNAFELGAAETWTKSVSTDSSGTQSTDRAHVRGVEASFQIPIFDLGQARTREAEETYMRAANRLAEKGVNARSEVREAYTAYRGAYDVARLYQSKVLPLRKTIEDESMLRYNGMIADLFILLQDARARVLSNVAAIEARRDFFVADADLHAAIVGGGMSGAEPRPSALAAAATTD
ncbi:MAG: TolC family protein [Hyphomicrobiales bacterium]|nr:TolC family protein [Hyphomicrobiales bacterium]